MKKVVSLVMAVVLSAVIFAGCAEKAEMQKLDEVAVTSVQNVATGKELDREAAVKAYNSATAGNILEDKEFTSASPILFITKDGVVAVFETGKNTYGVSSEMFDYDFEIECPELYELVSSGKE